MNTKELYDRTNQLPSILAWPGRCAKVMIAKDSVLELVRQLDESVILGEEVSTDNYDIVKKPKHYQGKFGLEAMAVVENFIGELSGKAAYCWGNVVKYLLRFQQKNGVEDLKKARQHLEWLIEEMEEKTNKQELKKQIVYGETLVIKDRMTQDMVEMVPKSEVLDLIDQLDEPQKPVIPQYVAEWIELAQEKRFSLSQAIEHWSRPEKIEKWSQYASNQETFARAWLDGYDVEREKLYTVEIPNPARTSLEFVMVLKRLCGSIVLVNTYDYMGRELSDEYRLTESEIRKDFDWAWQAGFAKEVE